MTGGKVEAKLKYGFITIFHQTLNLCDIAKDANIPCPVANGTHSFKMTKSVPDIGVSIHPNSILTGLHVSVAESTVQLSSV